MGGLKFCTLIFILTVSIWLSSVPYITEARQLNGLGVPGNAGETWGVFEKLFKIESSSGLSSGGRGHSYKYSGVTEITKPGPSPGEGHKNVPSVYQWFPLSTAPKRSSFICPISRSKRWCFFFQMVGTYSLLLHILVQLLQVVLSLRVFYSELSLSCLCDQTCFGKYTACMESYPKKRK